MRDVDMGLGDWMDQKLSKSECAYYEIGLCWPENTLHVCQYLDVQSIKQSSKHKPVTAFDTRVVLNAGKAIRRYARRHPIGQKDASQY